MIIYYYWWLFVIIDYYHDKINFSSIIIAIIKSVFIFFDNKISQALKSIFLSISS